MGFGVNAYATVKNIATDEKGNVTVQVSTSYKDRNSNSYKTDFLSKYVQLRGNALDKVNELRSVINSSEKQSTRIKITSCSSSNCYEDSGGTLKFLRNDRHTLFDFEFAENSGNSSNNSSSAKTPINTLPSPEDLNNPEMFIPAGIDEDLPFN